jgi:hypothetical protein
MQHVDDGTLHAWLDEQITEPAEAARIEEHLAVCAECAARLAAERAVFERAQELLSSTAPAGEQPSFETLVARAGSTSSVSPAAPVPSFGGLRRHALWSRVGLAASLALAVGLGWTARDFAGRDQVRLFAPAAEPERGAAASSDSNQRVEAPATAAPTRSTAAPPQASLRAADARARSAELSDPVPPEPAEDVARSVAGERPVVDVQSARPAPAAPPAAEATKPLAALTESVTVPRQEAVVPGGVAMRAAAGGATTSWRPLPRTEAAARTGMALYGIPGLVPAATEVSGDGALVRTVYRLGSGDVVELVQERLPQRGRALSSEPMVVESARRSLESSREGGIVADRVRSAPRVWSGVRGDVRLTLQTTAGAVDLDGLVGKLSVE